jgi:hypothetical protein
MKKLDARQLGSLFGMTLAMLATGARGFSCGRCGDPITTVVPLLPKANGPDSGAGGALPPLDDARCQEACGVRVLSCRYVNVDAADVDAIECVVAMDCGGAGRRPEGFAAAARRGRTNAGAWLAGIADLEGASVDAFRVLHRELRAHGAPGSLVRRASAAAKDERRHARTMRSHARRHDARAGERARRRVAMPVRSLRAMVTENAVEGCVRETFAALLAHHQALHAKDAPLRRAMEALARDETRHASLALAVHAWAMPRLSDADQAVVLRAVRRAAAKLLRAPLDATSDVREIVGLPDRRTAARLARALVAALELHR